MQNDFSGISDSELFELNVECIKMATGNSDLSYCSWVFQCILETSNEISTRLALY